MKVLELKNISASYNVSKRTALTSKQYNGLTVLKDINLSIDDGDFIGILGPNGAGKSTLIKVMSKVIPLKSGKAFLYGGELSRMSLRNIAKHIAVVSHDMDFTFPFLVHEVVLIGRTPYLKRFYWETKKDTEVVKKAMELSDISHLANRRIDSLSSGEKQRVIIAKALAQESKILLLDEPTSHLDLKHQIETCKLIKNLNRENKLTVVMVSHDINLASMFCDKIVLLKDGKIAAIGSPKEVVTHSNLSKVYDVEVSIGKHPEFDGPYVFIKPPLCL